MVAVLGFIGISQGTEESTKIAQLNLKMINRLLRSNKRQHANDAKYHCTKLLAAGIAAPLKTHMMAERESTSKLAT